MDLKVKDILLQTGGELLAGRLTEVCRHISTDSRSIKRGEWFLALVGDNFDGHDFIETAKRAGAGGYIVSKPPSEFPTSGKVPIVLVHDTLAAFGDIAALWRSRLSVNVITVTGSSGKTTTKDLLGRLIRPLGSALVTQGNLNNLIGVPHQIQRLTRRHQWAVLEIGMNVPGEIDALAQMTSPKIGVITNVGDAHVGMFDGKRDGVLNAKAEMLPHIQGGGTLVLNADNSEPTALLTRRAKKFGLRVVKFSARRNRKADLWIDSMEPLFPLGHRVTLATQDEFVAVDLKIHGAYNVANLAAAALAACVAGVPLAKMRTALRGFQPTGHRSSVRHANGAVLIVDCYNANPQSMTESIASLGAMPCEGRRVAVLGDMLELGKRSASLHREVGRAVRAAKIDHLVTFGRESRLIANAAKGIPTRHFTVIDACTRHLAKWLREGDAVLIKGSRLLAMERIADALGVKR